MSQPQFGEEATTTNTAAPTARVTVLVDSNHPPIRVIGGPWPERIGLTGYIVPKLRDEYPWAGCPRHEVVIFIKDDPLNAHLGRDYTCVIGRKDITTAAAEPRQEETR